MTSTMINTFSPGEYIREELDARGWTQADLAEIMGRTPTVISEVVAGKRSVTPETARGLADAFGTTPELWLNLETAFQLSHIRATDGTVSRKAKLFSFVPIKEMQRRGWIESTGDVADLESEILRFFGISSLGEEMQISHAARKSTDYGSLSSAQLAWLHRVRQLASGVGVAKTFSKRLFQSLMAELLKLKSERDGIRHVPTLLARHGIRFVIAEPLAGTKIDGVTLWLNNSSPVIALSLRYDRIDWFWHTLAHELYHVEHGDGMEAPTLDTEMVGFDAQPFNARPDNEKNADTFAADFLIPKKELDDFVARTKPFYSHAIIEGFAKRIEVHPGIVVGQLQFRKEIDYKQSRRFLVKVRDVLTATTLTDGWGHFTRLGLA